MSREREPDQRLVKGWFCSGLSNLTTISNCLSVLNVVRFFLSLPKKAVTLARVANYIPNFFASFHKFISFCQLGSILK